MRKTFRPAQSNSAPKSEYSSISQGEFHHQSKTGTRRRATCSEAHVRVKRVSLVVSRWLHCSDMLCMLSGVCHNLYPLYVKCKYLLAMVIWTTRVIPISYYSFILKDPTLLLWQTFQVIIRSSLVKFSMFCLGASLHLHLSEFKNFGYKSSRIIEWGISALYETQERGSSTDIDFSGHNTMFLRKFRSFFFYRESENLYPTVK